MDRSLLQAAQSGDMRARDALARWLMGELSTFFRRRHPPDHADELSQASMEELFSQLSDAPDDPTLFRGWALQRAGMRARAIRRDTNREQARIADSPPHPPAESPSVSVMDPLIDAAERELILHHAQRLQPIHRAAIMHVLLDGGDYKSLAADEGIPEMTAWHRLRRSEELVRQSIEMDRRTDTPYRTPK